MMTELPTGPLAGESPVTDTGSKIVKVAPLLVMPSSVTVTGPFAAFDGTVTVTAVSLHELTVAVTLLN
jgi:hypothetical protein